MVRGDIFYFINIKVKKFKISVYVWILSNRKSSVLCRNILLIQHTYIKALVVLNGGKVVVVFFCFPSPQILCCSKEVYKWLNIIIMYDKYKVRSAWLLMLNYLASNMKWGNGTMKHDVFLCNVNIFIVKWIISKKSLLYTIKKDVVVCTSTLNITNTNEG